jgi:amino acid transporter
VVGLGIIGIWWVTHLLTGHSRGMDPVGLYAESSTMGTIVILLVYLLTNIALPVFIWRRHRALFSPLRHVVVPILGSAVLVVPFVELCQPGQPSPYGIFPFIALGVVALAVAIAGLVLHRHPSAGSSEAAAPPPAA